MSEIKYKKTEALRTGFTTGTSVTAAVLACVYAIYGKTVKSSVIVKAPAGNIEVPVRYVFTGDDMAEASVIKDGGDDPDCTHGIKVIATVYKQRKKIANSFYRDLKELSVSNSFNCYTGKGIGIVTKEGLPVKVGEPAVNPVPRKVLKENIEDLIKVLGINEKPTVILTVPEGAIVAKHTLNAKLGISDGISILGTTGIVKPVSMDAFTATIDLSLNIAKSKRLKDVVLCFGRTSEDGARKVLNYPEESYVMMGDFLGYAVDKAKKMKFNVTVAGQIAKIFKAALEVENTNVKYSVFSPKQVAGLLTKLSVEDKYIKMFSEANTARHLYEIAEELKFKGLWENLVKYVAGKYKIKVLLFSYSGELLARA